DAGLNRISNGAISVYTRTNGLPSNGVASLLADSEGVLWVGTGSGLARLRNGNWSVFTTRDGLAANSIGFILEDALHYLWMGSTAGIMRVAKDAFEESGGQMSLPVRAYTKQDGLPTRECSQGSQPAAWRGQEMLWFSTIKGLVGVNPDEIG